jgi:hypothetical protein
LPETRCENEEGGPLGETDRRLPESEDGHRPGTCRVVLTPKELAGK